MAERFWSSPTTFSESRLSPPLLNASIEARRETAPSDSLPQWRRGGHRLHCGKIMIAGQQYATRFSVRVPLLRNELARDTLRFSPRGQPTNNRGHDWHSYEHRQQVRDRHVR
jgi:hypothetical protein